MIRSTLLYTCILFSFSSFAWGPVGHRTVGNIAEKQLSPVAQNAIRNLLGNKSLADWSNWADAVRGNGKYGSTGPYHYEKSNDGYKFLDYEKWLDKDGQKKGGVVEAILVATTILREGTAPKDAQIDALKFLIHFVGDVHQPLHTGRFDDRGGNNLNVSWFGTPSQLHRVWDSQMINTGHADILGSNSPNKASEIYADWLIANMKTPESTDMDVEKWFDESSSQRPDLYDSSYVNDQKRYQAKFLPVIDKAIFSAGLRLGNLLNQIFEKKPISPKESDFRRNLEQIVGKLSDIISFRP